MEIQWKSTIILINLPIGTDCGPVFIDDADDEMDVTVL